MTSAADSPSDAAPQALPSYVRARGAIRARFTAATEGARLADLYEAGGYRLRFPRGGETREAVIVNTGGGVAGGDEVTLDIALEAGARVLATTVAAEKIYRSDGAAARIDVSLDVAAGASLEWAPQETILFDAAALTRRLDASVAADASLTMVESVVFGRIAMGERCGPGALHDRWRVRRAGRLVFAEDLRFDGAIQSLLDRLAVGAGARAAATLLHVSPQAETRLEPLREALAAEPCECAASAWDGMVVARFVSPLPESLRRAVMAATTALRGAGPPRLWRS
ncbi:MAG: urease accessory protein UreD [Methylobacteriaceae bacterium]|nr:urease accessory protein UreD [Methylobacteriaceae bacterium]